MTSLALFTVESEPWVDDAICGPRGGLSPKYWDADVDDETELQQQTRHEIAKAVCRTCPVFLDCRAVARSTNRRTVTLGVRAGRVFR